MAPPVPEPLQRAVQHDGEALLLWVPGPSARLATAQRATAVIVLVGLIAPVVTLGVGAFLWLVLLPMIVGLWIWVLRAPLHHRLARIGPEGVELVPPRPVRDGPPARIEVRGPLGRPCKVYVGDRLVLDATMDAEGPWRPSTLTWFAHELSRITGAELHDERPLAEWDRWEHDPVARAVTEFDVRRVDNEAKWPWHHARPLQAMEADIDHHGMRVRVLSGMPPFVAHTDVEMTVDRLRCGEHDLDLAEVLRVGWFAHRSETTDAGGGADTAELHVLTRTQWVRLFTLRGEGQVRDYAGAMSWLCEQILERAEYARNRRPVDQGEASDVPQALRALAAKRRERA